MDNEPSDSLPLHRGLHFSKPLSLNLERYHVCVVKEDAVASVREVKRDILVC